MIKSKLFRKKCDFQYRIKHIGLLAYSYGHNEIAVSLRTRIRRTHWSISCKISQNRKQQMRAKSANGGCMVDDESVQSSRSNSRQTTLSCMRAYTCWFGVTLGKGEQK